MSGEIGAIGVARSNEEMMLNQRVGRLELTVEEPSMLRFLGFYLQQPEMKPRWRWRLTGLLRPIRPARGELPVAVPPAALRSRVVEILGSIDDLIESNRRRIEILEEMAQAIYREWFVHFRFPGHETATFVDSPLGPIPEDWTGASFSDLVTLVKKTVSPEAIEQGAPVVGLEHIPREQLTLDDWEEAAEVGSRRECSVGETFCLGKFDRIFQSVDGTF